MTLRTIGALLCLLSLPTVAEAQADVADVQQTFEAGTAALRAGRFHEARDLLREAHHSARAVGTAFNLAVALRGTGEVVECASLFGRLLEGEFGDLTQAVDGQARALRRECGAASASLSIRVNRSADVLVDGESVGLLPPDTARELRLDPGAHVVTAAHRGFVTAQERVELARGGRAEVSLELVAIVMPELLRLSPESPRASPPHSSVFGKVWFWLSVVGGVLVAGAVTWAVTSRDPSVADPVASPWSEPRVIP